jgi:hypothetical protein
MALKILDAPLTISLEALQTGIQKEEDQGLQLVDLTKGFSGGVSVNLASFQERTEKLQDIQLTPTPGGLFVFARGSFSVDPALSANFIKQMADKALAVVLYCPIVSIGGSNCSLAVSRSVVTGAASGMDPLQPTILSWDNPERKAWSAELIASVTQSIALLEQGNPNAFVNGYNTLSRALQTKFWAELFIAIAKFESGWDPRQTYHESKLDVDSIGLLQLSYQDKDRYKLEPLSEAANSLKDPLVNLRCGVKIFTTLVVQDRTVASSASGIHRGAARYWSVLRPGQKVDQILALTKKHVGL